MNRLQKMYLTRNLSPFWLPETPTAPFLGAVARFWATCRKLLDKNRLDLMASRLRFRQSNRKREIETRCHLSR